MSVRDTEDRDSVAMIGRLDGGMDGCDGCDGCDRFDGQIRL